MPPMLNLRHLTAALVVRQLGSISRATDRAHLSQSAITQGLSKLERELGRIKARNKEMMILLEKRRIQKFRARQKALKIEAEESAE